MDSSKHYFTGEIVKPMKLVQVPRSSSETSSEKKAEVASFKVMNLKELSSHLDTEKGKDFIYGFFSICQRSGWGHLHTSKPMLELLVRHYGIHESFWDVVSCFYSRSTFVEETFSVPYTERRNGQVTEVSYTIVYPEKNKNQEWVIRQTGVYHRLDLGTRKSFFVLFSPHSSSSAHNKAEKWLKNSDNSDLDPLGLHKAVIDTCLPNWRKYTEFQEKRLLQMTSALRSTTEPPKLKHDDLAELGAIENRFLQISTILSSSQDILKGLFAFSTRLQADRVRKTTPDDIENLRRRCESFARTATYLHQRAQATVQLQGNILSFKAQRYAQLQDDDAGTQQQDGVMLSLNTIKTSVVFMTVLAVVYLPPSFMAVFFGMSFFHHDSESGQPVVTSAIWIYFFFSMIMVVGTCMFYHKILHGTTFSKHVPKIKFPKLGGWRRLGFTGREKKLVDEEKVVDGEKIVDEKKLDI